MGRKAIIRKDLTCPSLRRHGQVRQLGRQRYLEDCGKYCATYHHYLGWKVEQALKY